MTSLGEIFIMRENEEEDTIFAKKQKPISSEGRKINFKQNLIAKKTSSEP